MTFPDLIPGRISRLSLTVVVASVFAMMLSPWWSFSYWYLAFMVVGLAVSIWADGRNADILQREYYKGNLSANDEWIVDGPHAARYLRRPKAVAYVQRLAFFPALGFVMAFPTRPTVCLAFFVAAVVLMLVSIMLEFRDIHGAADPSADRPIHA